MQKINDALKALQQGKMIILTDDDQRENEGDLIFPAEKITPEIINFMIRHCTGIICLSLLSDKLKQINSPLIVPNENNDTQHGTPFTIPVDAKTGISTGVSASDRAYTILTCLRDDISAQDLVRPGHIFPLQAREGGVLERPGHTEGAVDIVRLAGFQPAAVLCEVMNPDGTMARGEYLRDFAKQHEFVTLSINDIIAYRSQEPYAMCDMAKTHLPLKHHGDFTAFAFKEKYTPKEHLVLYKKPTAFSKNILARIHSACITGDIFSSLRCDCQEQLHDSLAQIANTGGILIYLDQEGRDIGLFNKIKAYALQEQGLDTIEANQALGFLADQRRYVVAANILHTLGFTKVDLLTNNPKKITELKRCGINVNRKFLSPSHCNPHNQHYLHTKKTKLHHYM